MGFRRIGKMSRKTIPTRWEGVSGRIGGGRAEGTFEWEIFVYAQERVQVGYVWRFDDGG